MNRECLELFNSHLVDYDLYCTWYCLIFLFVFLKDSLKAVILGYQISQIWGNSTSYVWQILFCKGGHNSISQSSCSYTISLPVEGRERAYILPLNFGRLLWLPWPKEYGESDAVWFSRQDQKCDVHLALSGCLLLEPSAILLGSPNSAHKETIWRNQP